MSWSLLWIFCFLALYLVLGAQRLATVLMAMLFGALLAHTVLGQIGVLAGALAGCVLGVTLVYLSYSRTGKVGKTAV